jgi:outer membrane immunogenic protein
MHGIKLAALASVICVVSAPAFSADLPRMPVKAAPVMVPVYSWTGFYIGAHAGYGWGEHDLFFVNGTPPFPAGGTNIVEFDGAVAGGQVGYNWQFAPNWLIGIEGDIAWSGMEGSAVSASTVPAFIGLRSTTTTAEIDWVATLTARIGFAANNWLIYAKGGAAWADFTTNTRTVNPALGGLLIATTASSETRTGWTAGGGVEWGFAPNWSLKAEYNYLDFGSDTVNQTVTFDFFGTVPNPLVRNVDTHIHIVKGGVNFRFGG